MNRLVLSILTALNKEGRPLSSKELATQLASQGIVLSERTVRYYFQKFDACGFTEGSAKKGRKITAKGRQELAQGFVSERVGFIINKINNLAFLADFDPDHGRGKVILNITNIQAERLQDALDILQPLLYSSYAMSNRILLARSGELLGDYLVPAGSVAIGTICSITLNSILLKSGIPVSTKFGGIVEIRNSQPIGFSSAISYEGSSVPPFEILIKGRMTDVLGALRRGTGKILGSFREIPIESLGEAEKINKRMKRPGFRSCIFFGQPGEPLMGLPVTEGKVGMVVLGGLNPIAGLEEAGLVFDTRSIAMLQDYLSLSPVDMFTEDRDLERRLVPSLYPNTKETPQNIGYLSI